LTTAADLIAQGHPDAALQQLQQEIRTRAADPLTLVFASFGLALLLRSVILLLFGPDPHQYSTEIQMALRLPGPVLVMPDQILVFGVTLAVRFPLVIGASPSVPGANLRWSIGPPRLIESVTDLKSGASVAEIQSIPMRLEADSVHEREWLDLLARLNNTRKSQLRVQSCEWGASSLPYGPGTVSVMRSLCDVLWIHAQPPVPADKPPGS